MRLRVMFASPVPDFRGGAERSLFDLMENPAIVPILVIPAEGPLSEAACARGIACEVLPLGRVADVHRPLRPTQAWLAAVDGLRAVRLLKRLARARGVDIIHTNGPKMHMIACLARLLGCPRVVVHLRQIPWTGLERVVWWFWSLCATRVVLVSRACWPSRTLPKHARIVPNAIDVPSPVQVRPGTPGPIRIGFVGRIAPDKGLDVLLDWLALARDHGIHFQLSIRGSATAETEGYACAIRCKVTELALGEQIRFDGFREGLAEIYEGLDVVVVPSIVPDPLPRTVMEAQSLGIPVMAYPSGGIPEMIEDRRTGFLVSSADDFVGALEQLTHEPDRFAGIAAAAYEAITERNGLDRLHAQMTELYDALTHREREFAARSLAKRAPGE